MRPATGSIWEVRYRVLGESAVWAGMYVCELLSGPDKGKTHVLDGSAFMDEPAGDGVLRRGLAPARKRPSDAVAA